MEQEQDLQKRLLLALVLSFAVFVLFDIFVPKPQTGIENNGTKPTKEKVDITNQTPQVATQAKGAVPVTDNHCTV